MKLGKSIAFDLPLTFSKSELDEVESQQDLQQSQGPVPAAGWLHTAPLHPPTPPPTALVFGTTPGTRRPVAEACLWGAWGKRMLSAASLGVSYASCP